MAARGPRRVRAPPNPRQAPGRIQEGGHLRPDGSRLKTLIDFALVNDEAAIATRLLDSTGADGVLWIGIGDALLSSRIRGTISRTTLDEEAFALIDCLQHRHGFQQAPEFPEVDVDESLVFDPAEPHPKWKWIVPALAEGRCLGGALIFSRKAFTADERVIEECARALTVSFLIRQQQRRIDAATDRLNELSEAGRIFTGVGEPTRTMSRILELATRASMAETGVIVHIDRGGRLSATGMSLATISGVRFRSGESIVERALAAESVVIIGAERMRAELDPASTNMVIDTIAAFPLLHELRTCGAMILVNIAPILLADDHFIAVLGTVANLAAAAITVEERQKDLVEQELTRQELASAHAIQMSLLPKEIPPFMGLTMAGMWKPSRTVGGDFYDILPLSPTKLGIIMADVSGKGIPAGLLMTIARSYFRVIAVDFVSSPGGALQRINRLLCNEIADNRFITASYIVIDVANRKGLHANAGHYPPALLAADGTPGLLSSSAGPPLGIQPQTEYEDAEFRFDPGSALLLYTDGLVETRGADARILGSQGILDTLRGRVDLDPQALLDLLWVRTISFARHAEPTDDWTAVAVKYTAGA